VGKHNIKPKKYLIKIGLKRRPDLRIQAAKACNSLFFWIILRCGADGLEKSSTYYLRKP